MDSRRYWKLREEQNRQEALQNDYLRGREIGNIFAEMQSNIDAEIARFYQQYATSEGITYAEAMQRVSKLDMAAYEAKAKYYVEAAHKGQNAIAFSKQAEAEMKLYNLTMKVNRLEMLKANIGLQMVKGYNEIEAFMSKELETEAYKEYKRMAGILGETVNNNTLNAEALPGASYKNAVFLPENVNAKFFHATNETFFHATFSNRIWTHYGELKANLDGLLARALVNGESGAKLSRELAKAMDTSLFNARRLIITETARVRVEVQKQSYERNGNKEYVYMALGANPCPDCADLDGQHFSVDDMSIGFNAPPMHPFCHCTTAPYTVAERELLNTRLAEIEAAEE